MPSSSLRFTELLGGIAPFAYLQFFDHSPSHSQKFIVLPEFSETVGIMSNSRDYSRERAVASSGTRSSTVSSRTIFNTMRTR